MSYTLRAAHCEGNQEDQTTMNESDISTQPCKLRFGDTMEDLQFNAAHNRERYRNLIEFTFVERMCTFPRQADDNTQPTKHT